MLCRNKNMNINEKYYLFFNILIKCSVSKIIHSFPQYLMAKPFFVSQLSNGFYDWWSSFFSHLHLDFWALCFGIDLSDFKVGRFPCHHPGLYHLRNSVIVRYEPQNAIIVLCHLCLDLFGCAFCVAFLLEDSLHPWFFCKLSDISDNILIYSSFIMTIMSNLLPPSVGSHAPATSSGPLPEAWGHCAVS